MMHIVACIDFKAEPPETPLTLKICSIRPIVLSGQYQPGCLRGSGLPIQRTRCVAQGEGLTIANSEEGPEDQTAV